MLNTILSAIYLIDGFDQSSIKFEFGHRFRQMGNSREIYANY